MIKIINSKPGQYLNLKNGWIFYVDYEICQIFKNKTDSDKFPYINKKYIVQTPGKTMLKDWTIETEYTNQKDKYIFRETQNKQLGKIEYSIGLDCSEKKQNIYVRTRISGDRFQPLGMKNNQKLQDFMTNLKIPQRIRDSIPLILCGNNIAWVVGYRISELYKTNDLTKKQLLIKISRNIK